MVQKLQRVQTGKKYFKMYHLQINSPLKMACYQAFVHRSARILSRSWANTSKCTFWDEKSSFFISHKPLDPQDPHSHREAVQIHRRRKKNSSHLWNVEHLCCDILTFSLFLNFSAISCPTCYMPLLTPRFSILFPLNYTVCPPILL